MATLPTTRVLDPADYPRWSAAVAASPDGSVYSLPDYLDALCSATGGRFRVLAAERDDHIVGGIALFECSGRGGPVGWAGRRGDYNRRGLGPPPAGG
ncbi:MAG: hypothetical protein ACTHJ9_00450, partial [Rhodanobacter sp.]